MVNKIKIINDDATQKVESSSMLVGMKIPL